MHASPATTPLPQNNTTKPNPIVTLENVTKTYGSAPNAFTALYDISFQIGRGKMIALIGRSGSGKSTLLNLLGAVDRPTQGTVHITSTNLAELSDTQLALFRRRHLGFVFQSFHLLPDLNIFDNIAVSWTLDRHLTRARRQEITDLLNRLGLADKAHRHPDELSGGQQQRVALARAIIRRPQLILADEPTGNLDAQNGRAILDLLLQLQREFNTTVILATHAQEAAERCDAQIELADGRIIHTEGSLN